MSKAIRFKDDTYLHSTGVIHNKEKLSKILNTTVSQVVSEIGWYKIAELHIDTSTLYGGATIINVTQSYYYYEPETHTLLIQWCYNGCNITQLGVSPRDRNVITKYRVVNYNSETSPYGSTVYLEMYFNNSKPQTFYINRLTSYMSAFTLLSPIKTTDTPLQTLNEISVS